MPENETRAWWVDVQHVRESIERRRGDAGGSIALAEALAPAEPRTWTPTADHGTSTATAELTAQIDSGAPEALDAPPDDAWLDAPPEGRRGRRFERTDADEPPIPRLAELDWPPMPPAGGTRRFEHPGRADRAGGLVDRPRSATHRADRPRIADRHAPDRDDAGARTTTAPTADVTLERDIGPPARRTVQITGRTVAAPSLPRLVEVERRRPGRRPVERVGPRPDRIALYAVLLGFFLILVAATSAHS